MLLPMTQCLIDKVWSPWLCLKPKPTITLVNHPNHSHDDCFIPHNVSFSLQTMFAAVCSPYPGANTCAGIMRGGHFLCITQNLFNNVLRKYNVYLCHFAFIFFFGGPLSSFPQDHYWWTLVFVLGMLWSYSWCSHWTWPYSFHGLWVRNSY